MKPREIKNGAFSALGEGLAFGGGYKNGGLSPKAMDLLRPIFSFDYMGAAEFEYGALPDSLNSMIAGISDYGSHEVKLEDHTVYVFCNNNDIGEITKVIEDIYKDEYKMDLKGYPRLKDSLIGQEFASDIIGWLELDNNFFFFKDKEAFDKLMNLFKD
jgi:hypothetical protein